MTVRLLGVFIRKESQRCVRQVSPIPRRSRTRWHTSARFNALLTPSPAQPAPTTTAARVSGLLVIVRKSLTHRAPPVKHYGAGEPPRAGIGASCSRAADELLGSGAQSFDRGIEALSDEVASCARAGAWGAEPTAGHTVNVGPL